MAHPRPPTQITRFTLERYSVPDPGRGPSPAKVRNSTLEWMHYEGHEDAPLGIVVEERSGEGIAGRETCALRIVQGGHQHRQFSVDTYRDAYDAARAVRDVVQESGDGYRRGQDDDGAVVDTIRLTVKPPSVAIRLLQPLGQLKSRYATIRATGDYTYDRFQIRFANTHDIPAFLAILHRHLPALDLSQTLAPHMELERAGSIALSQGTCPYMPDDPYRVIRMPVQEVQRAKKRRIDEEDQEYGNARGEDGRITEERDAFGRVRGPGRPIDDRTVRLSESSYASPPPLMDRQPRRNRQPSLDQDGFAKPLAPAYIDTPTPANRIYHLSQLDPNQRRQDARRPVAASPRKTRTTARVTTYDSFQDSRHATELVERGSAAPINHPHAHRSALPPLRQQMSCPPYISESVESRPTGYTLPPPPGEDSGEMPRSDSPQAASRLVGYSRPEPEILAPETVSNAMREKGASVKAWPAIYSRPSSGLRAMESVIGETPGLQRTDAVQQGSLAAEVEKNHDRTRTYGRQFVGNHMTGNGDEIFGNSEGHVETRPISPDEPLDRITMQNMATHFTAKITRTTSLYALSFEELEDAINEIIMEEGFIPFVEKIERSWRQRLERIQESDQERVGDIGQP